MNFYFKFLRICILLLILYFLTCYQHNHLIYIKILAHMNSYIMWFVLISIFFSLFIIVYTLWNMFGSVTYFDKFSFPFIHQDLKFLKN